MSVMGLLSEAEWQLVSLYIAVVVAVLSGALGSWPELLSPAMLLRYGHLALIGSIALTLAPFHHTAASAVRLPMLCVILVYCYSAALFLYSGLSQQGLQWLWQQLLPAHAELSAALQSSPLLTVMLVSHLLCVDLLAAQYMVHDFYSHYTAGYNVTPQPDGSHLEALSRPWNAARWLMTVIVAVTYLCAPLGLLLYFTARASLWSQSRTAVAIDVHRPQGVDVQSHHPKYRPDIVLDVRPVDWSDWLASTLRQLYRLCAAVVSVPCALAVLLLVWLPFCLYCRLKLGRQLDIPTAADGFSQQAIKFLRPGKPPVQTPVPATASLPQLLLTRLQDAVTNALNSFPPEVVRYKSSELIWSLHARPAPQWGWLHPLPYCRYRFLHWLGQLSTILTILPAAEDPVGVYQANRGDMALILYQQRLQAAKQRAQQDGQQEDAAAAAAAAAAPVPAAAVLAEEFQPLLAEEAADDEEEKAGDEAEAAEQPEDEDEDEQQEDDEVEEEDEDDAAARAASPPPPPEVKEGSVSEQQQQQLRQQKRAVVSSQLKPPEEIHSDTDFFPYGLGLGVGSYWKTRLYLADNPRKTYISAGWPVSDSQIPFCTFNPVFQSTVEDDGVTPYAPAVYARACIHAWLANFPHKLPLTGQRIDSFNYRNGDHLCPAADTFMQLNRLVPRSNQEPPASAELVYRAVGEVLFFLSTGGLLRADERAAFCQIIGSLASFFPTWANFLALGRHGERQNRQSWQKLMMAHARYASGPALVAAFKAGQGFADKTEVLRMVSQAFAIAGSIAQSKLSFSILQRLWGADRQQNVVLYGRDPVAFIKEAARLDKAVPMVNILASPTIVRHVQECTGATIAADTRVHLAIPTANRDPAVFPDGDTFDPTRGNLDMILSWNGSIEDWVKGGAANPTRFCPGHSLSLAVMQFVISRFAPVLPEEETTAASMWTSMQRRLEAQRLSSVPAHDDSSGQQANAAAPPQLPTGSRHHNAASPQPAHAGEAKENGVNSAAGSDEPMDETQVLRQLRYPHLRSTSQRDKAAGSQYQLRMPVSAADSAHANHVSAVPSLAQPEAAVVPAASSSLSAASSSSAASSLAAELSRLPLPGWSSMAEQAILLQRVQSHLLSSQDRDELVDSLDWFTRLIILLMQQAVAKYNAAPPRAADMLAPINLPTHSLQPIRVDAGKTLPTWDEDESAGQDPLLAIAAALLNAQFLWPFNDLPKQFTDHAEAQRWRLQLFSALPPPNIAYDELDSDEAQGRLAFNGQWCHHTQRIDWSLQCSGIPQQRLLQPHDPQHPAAHEAVYVNDQTALHQFRVRDPFERYGAAAYFNVSRQLIAVYWSHGGRLLTRREHGHLSLWQHVKLVWRTSAFTFCTVRDHLLLLHLIESNALTSASRECLPELHPLRVFLKPFTFRTVSINHQAAQTLINDRGLVHRVWAFDYGEFLHVCDWVTMNYRFRLLPDWLHPSMTQPASAAVSPQQWELQYPIAADLPAFWRICRDYLSHFFDIEYPDTLQTDELDRDANLHAFVHELCKQLGLNGITSRRQLIDVLSQCVCAVTGLHEHVGQISDLLYKPSFINTKLKQGVEMQSVQTYSQHCVLVVLTGLRMPGLLEDWKHLCDGLTQAERHRHNHDLFKQRLRQRAEDIDRLNLPGQRLYPFQSFNPRFMECSVSV